MLLIGLERQITKGERPNEQFLAATKGTKGHPPGELKGHSPEGLAASRVASPWGTFAPSTLSIQWTVQDSGHTEVTRGLPLEGFIVCLGKQEGNRQLNRGNWR